LCATLAHQGLDRVDDRRCEKSYQNRVKSKGTNRFTQVDLFILVLQRCDDESSHDDAAKLEVGKVTCFGSYILSEAE
jgi:hypothetical protein